MSEFTYKLEGNETQCVARMYHDGKLVATVTSNAKLNITAVTYNRGPGLAARHEILNTGSFLNLSYSKKMLAALSGDTV